MIRVAIEFDVSTNDFHKVGDLVTGVIEKIGEEAKDKGLRLYTRSTGSAIQVGMSMQ